MPNPMWRFSFCLFDRRFARRRVEDFGERGGRIDSALQHEFVASIVEQTFRRARSKVQLEIFQSDRQRDRPTISVDFQSSSTVKKRQKKKAKFEKKNSFVFKSKFSNNGWLWFSLRFDASRRREQKSRFDRRWNRKNSRNETKKNYFREKKNFSFPFFFKFLVASRFLSSILAASDDDRTQKLIVKRLETLFGQIENLENRWIDIFESIGEPDLSHLGMISALILLSNKKKSTNVDRLKVH